MADNEQTRPEADEAEMMRQLREELQNLTVADHLLFMMQSLSALAVDRMGLTEEAGGRRDLDEARLAIDAFKALLDLVANARPGEDMRTHRSALSQLQMTYIDVLGDEGAKEGSSDAAAEMSEEAGTDSAETPTEASEEAGTDSPLGPTDGSVDIPTEAEADAPVESAPGSAADAVEGED
jgi:hypothetical protein